MRYFTFLAVGTLLCQCVLAQISDYSQKFEVNKTPGKQKINHWVVNPPTNSKSETNQEMKRYIVRLKSDPSRISGRTTGDNLSQEHQQFLSDVNRISGASPAGRSSNNQANAIIIHHEYTRTFNGFALSTTESVANEIRKLRYVTSLQEDKKIEAYDTQSNSVIRAPEAWTNFGATGKNVRIGIIDTGIDYNHPDLGSGFGPAFKVVGGYDFVNEDSDPMDDNGHGTHVAGIAAANGNTLKGVAPDAKLVAYKALNQDGSGYDSWILAAIERCVDPDQNPNTDDALDVVNMSLGRQADPNEPYSEAVNNAVASGVVFVVAAGNSFDYFSVGTPGVAKGAITVGATDNAKQTAYFSSRGPTENTFLIKPEVAAPGVDINSTFPNNKYEKLSGTSMASPHVTGAVALILEKKPAWTPEMVKSCLVGSARSTSTYIWDQGAGVIDIYESLSASFVSEPAVINLGIPEASESWSKNMTLKVTNTGTTLQSFTTSSEHDIATAPFTLTITPSTFSLDGGQVKEIQVTISANSLTLPIRNLPEAFSGSIDITSGGFTTKTPVALVNPQRTRVNFTGELPNSLIVIGIEGSYYWKPYSTEAAGLNLFLPKAKYDFITFYPNDRMVITEGVNTEQNVDLTLDKSLAKNLILFKPLDKSGNEILFPTYGSAFFWGEDRNIITLFPYPVDSMYVSDQEHYHFEFKYHGKSSADVNEYYEVTANTGKGTLENKTCSNDPAKFSHIALNNPGIADGLKQNITYYTKSGGPSTWFTNWNNDPIEMPGKFTLLQSQHNLNTLGYLGSFLTLSPPSEQSGYVWETADIRAEEGDKLSFYQHIDRKILTLDQPDLDFTFGKTIPNFILWPSHEDTVLRYSTFLGRGSFNHAFGERERGNVYFKLYTNNAVIKEGYMQQSINNQFWSGLPPINVTAGEYHLDFEYDDFQTGGKFSKAKVSTHFNTTQADKNPPWLKEIRLLINGHDSNELQENDNGVIQFSVSDVCGDYYCSVTSAGLKTTSLKIKPKDAGDWTTITLNQVSDGSFTASIPSGLSPGYYSLLLASEDNSNNTFTYEVASAFLVGPRQQPELFTAINPIEPKNHSINAGTNPLFRWSAMEGYTYEIQISSQSDFTGNVIKGTTTEPKYALLSPLEKDKTYYWRVRAVQNDTPLRWSVIFQFESKLLPTATLLSPADKSQTDYHQVEFSWSPPWDAFGYILEVSLDENFSQLIWTEWTGNLTTTVFSLLPKRQYFWRVKSRFFAGWDIEESVSNVFSFVTNSLARPVLISPEDKSIDQPISNLFQWSAVEDAQSYNFELSKVEGFSIPLFNLTTENTSLQYDILEEGTEYFWRVTPQSFGVAQDPSSTFKFKTAKILTAIESRNNTFFNYPNPFNTQTYFVINSDVSLAATIRIVDQLGREIKVFQLDLLQGLNNVSWDGRSGTDKQTAPGLYFAFLSGQEKSPSVIRLAKTE